MGLKSPAKGGCLMATQRINVTTTLKIKVENGATATGATKYATRTVSNINPEITDDDMLAIGEEFAALQTHAVGDIQRSEVSTLVNNA
ncbi:DUF1659 domain-containing protein [uncultured Mitsuokella sp.]|uniref:DUF1659 domain-containing protein n=1 Tax=uncultured Mitsuokella sp. TaxID=453120 RepID=UPI002618D896|nr:DUF1659 domain-containing protein [uncultured Mitsuokella sp.]